MSEESNELDSNSESDTHPRDTRDSTRDRVWTIPNALSLFRWVGSPGLILCGYWQSPTAFIVWYLVLALSDWLDGKIAVRYHQQSTLGARLDSFADATLYACALIGGILVWHEELLAQWIWVALACGSYGVATIAGFVKFGRWPSYHTRTAKASWLFVMVAIAGLAWGEPVWTLRIAMLAVLLANVESIAITSLLREWHSDVISVFIIRDGQPTLSKVESGQLPQDSM